MAMIDYPLNGPEQVQIKLVTWNHARAAQKVYKEAPETLFRDVDNVDIVVLAG